MKPLRNTVIACALGSLLLSCTAKIYVMDRHTILEDEAAGEWPALDQELLDKSKEPGPTAFQKTPINERKKRLYNVLNGEPPNKGR